MRFNKYEMEVDPIAAEEFKDDDMVVRLSCGHVYLYDSYVMLRKHGFTTCSVCRHQNVAGVCREVFSEQLREQRKKVVTIAILVVCSAALLLVFWYNDQRRQLASQRAEAAQLASSALSQKERLAELMSMVNSQIDHARQNVADRFSCLGSLCYVDRTSVDACLQELKITSLEI